MTDEELILMVAMTVRIACRQMTPGQLALGVHLGAQPGGRRGHRG